MTDTASAPSLRQALLVAAGLLALGFGLIGVVLPGLPTTPFVLSPPPVLPGLAPLHRWLTQHRYLGPMVRDWEAHRSLPLRIKWISTTLMLTMVALSAWQFMGRPWLQALLIALGLIGAWVVWRIPTRR
jgi:hypothetical protein